MLLLWRADKIHNLFTRFSTGDASVNTRTEVIQFQKKSRLWHFVRKRWRKESWLYHFMCHTDLCLCQKKAIAADLDLIVDSLITMMRWLCLGIPGKTIEYFWYFEDMLGSGEWDRLARHEQMPRTLRGSRVDEEKGETWCSNREENSGVLIWGGLVWGEQRQPLRKEIPFCYGGRPNAGQVRSLLKRCPPINE